jgi:hypothetical protein
MPFFPHSGSTPAQRLFHFFVFTGGGIILLETERALGSTQVEFQSTFMRQMENHARRCRCTGLENVVQ